MPIKALNFQNKLVDIPQSELEDLKSHIQGKLITPKDTLYDEARTVWNAMIDKKPAFIVRAISTLDVVKAVQFANQHQLQLSVRSAGHNIAGRGLQNETMLIDLSQMRDVKVDPVKKIATVQPGATLHDIDHQTLAFGLALPMGINSTTGISGLTLGGGFGWLSRKLGMTIDSLLSAEVVTVKGEQILCDDKHHPDLFWAIKGGGGNFGIVTTFTFKLHPIKTQVLSGPVVFDINDAPAVLKKYHQLCQKINNDLIIWALLREAPPFPFLDKSHHGKHVLILVFIYFGDTENEGNIIHQILSLGNPIGHGIQPNSFEAFQQIFDPFLTPGARNYWKTHNFKEIPEDLINILVSYGKNLPSSQSEVFIAQMGGLTNTIAKADSAYPHRDVNYVMNVHVRWNDKNDDKKCIDSARQFYQSTLPFATGGAYVNFVSEGDDSVKNIYGANAVKLAKIKAKYDPNNVLRGNMNIAPHNDKI